MTVEIKTSGHYECCRPYNDLSWYVYRDGKVIVVYNPYLILMHTESVCMV